jgi:CRISPR-associated endonuclease Csn1
MAKIRYRLGLDVGANSIGWCVYRLGANDEPEAIVRMGSRIFSDGRDPKTLASNAAERRQARQARRRRDRLLKRRQRLMQALIAGGLMPIDKGERKALEVCDPYVLRARGLDTALAPFEIGRALFHLGRKRGFKSSRKERKDAEAEKELGKVSTAIAALRERIAGAKCRTVGEYLATQRAQRLPVRGRRSSDGGYVLYLQRDMVAEEFDLLWAAQAPHHPSLLTVPLRDELRNILLFQRKLLPVLPGRCLFETNEHRAPLCSPLQQKFRILQELNNLRWVEGRNESALSLEQRNLLRDALLTRSRLTFTDARVLLGQPRRSPIRFNLEDGKRKELKGDFTSVQFAHPAALGERWWQLSDAQRESLSLLVERADIAEELEGALAALPADLAPAITAARLQPHELHVLDPLRTLPQGFSNREREGMARIQLAEGFGSLSLKALGKIVPALEAAVITYDQAVLAAGYTHHSNFYTGELHLSLPYYGELLGGYTSPMPRSKTEAERLHGRIPNPTVHIGLNQLRLLVNALIKRYGHPEGIVIELAREFGLSGERRREIQKEQEEAQERNQKLDAQLETLGIRPSRENRQKLMLWEELGRADPLTRRCVYSGRSLAMATLFTDEVEVDHILPFSRSLNDGVGNKVLCTRQANRDKGNRTPYEAFGHSPGQYRWDEIEARVAELPVRKARLFHENALEAFLAGRDFLDRHLSDTAYFGRAARQYLSAICPPPRIAVSTGKLTSLIRGKWALNELLSEDRSKNRDDHRHHALDAAVIGLCSRSLIQRMATAARRAEEDGQNRLLERFELPWPTFRDDLRRMLAGIVVSHRPDHGPEAALHNDTNYTLRGAPDKRGNPLVGRRVPIDSFTKPGDVDNVADPAIREQLRACLQAPSTKEAKAALAAFSARTGIRRVMKEERLAVIPIHDRRNGKPYRYVKGDGNYCYDIWQRPDGRWEGEVISLYAANRPGFDPNARHREDGTPLKMRLRRNDLIAIEQDGQRRVMRVAAISDGKVTLALHTEANADSRDRDKQSEFSYMRKSPGSLREVRARPVGVDVLGYVNDPGWRE